MRSAERRTAPDATAVKVSEKLRSLHRSKLDAGLTTLQSASLKRTHMIGVKVNQEELAKLEEERRKAGNMELAPYVRTVALSRRGIATVPELNRTAWVALLGRLEMLDEMAGKLGQTQGTKPGGLGGLLGRGRNEVTPTLLLAELRATREAIQALRRALVGTP